MRGTIIAGRYVVAEQIGCGGMGVVYIGHDLARTEPVAVKLLHKEHLPNSAAVAQIEHEVRAGCACRHHNVVAVLDHGTFDGRPFVIMEYVDGRALGTSAAGGKLSVRRVGAIVTQILEGLGALHGAGFVHGDLKSDNVLIGCGDAVKIIDLGLACADVRARTRDEAAVAIAGTPDYVAPELVLGGAKTIASDLYAVGVILYELLTGAPPFVGGNSVEVLRRQVDDRVIPPSQLASSRVSPALESVVMRALEKAPEARYRDTTEFAAALADALYASLGDHEIMRSLVARAPTEDCTQPIPVVFPPLAAGTRPPQDPDAITAVIETALELARTCIADHRLRAAAQELESAISATAEAAGSWRLLLPLAAVYDGLGNGQRSRRTARTALDRARRDGSEVGERRARALIDRLAGRSRTLV